jgi:uncharacterized protein
LAIIRLGLREVLTRSSKDAIMANMSFVIKCTRNCNFACSYCTNHRKNYSLLGLEIIIPLTQSALSVNKDYETTFIFHGGEPFLLGESYFNKILLVQQLAKTNGQVIKNIVQTNGSLLNEQWIDFLKKSSIGVGISMDGPEEIHNKNRLYRDKSHTYADVMNGVQKLIDNKIPFGVLAVVTEAMLQARAKKIFDFFASNGIGKYGLLPERPPKPYFSSKAKAEQFFLNRKRYSQFMCELYDLWLERDDPQIKVRELGSMMDAMIGGKPTLCIDNGPCIGKIFGVNDNGMIAHCDKFFNDKKFNFGKADEVSIEDILHSEVFEKAQDLEVKLRGKCQACDWFNECKGGCLFDAVLFENSGLENRMDICHTRLIYEHIDQHLTRAAGAFIETGTT